MEIHRALDQISEIHEHLARAEVYRGYRAVPVAVSGILALAAAAMQGMLDAAATPRGFVVYWVVMAAVGLIVAGGGIAFNYVARYDHRARRRTRIVVGQLLPSLTAGVVVTGALYGAGESLIPFLPGVWAVLYSLGIFASRPYLPRIIGFVALFYLVAGAVLLAMAEPGASPSPWGMGITFGVGQITAGLVLYWDLERKNDGWKT